MLDWEGIKWESVWRNLVLTGSFEFFFFNQDMQVRISAVPTEDGNGKGEGAMPTLGQATEERQGAFLQVPGTVLVACGLLQSSPQGRLGRTVHALVVLDLWAAVAVVALLQAVVEQAQVFLHLLGLVDGVRVQDLWDKARGQRRVRESLASQARWDCHWAKGGCHKHDIPQTGFLGRCF